MGRLTLTLSLRAPVTSCRLLVNSSNLCWKAVLYGVVAMLLLIVPPSLSFLMCLRLLFIFLELFADFRRPPHFRWPLLPSQRPYGAQQISYRPHAFPQI